MVIGCLRLSDISDICRVANPHRTSQKIWEVSCTKCTGQGNDFELISTVEIETRNPVEGYFGGEFPAIYNDCGVRAAWCRKMLKIKKCDFWEKRRLTVKFSKFCFESFYRDTDQRVVFKCRDIWPTGNRWNRALLTWQKISPCSPAVAAAARIAPNICQGQPSTMYSEFSRFHPNRFTFGGVIAERVNTAKTRRKINPIFG